MYKLFVCPSVAALFSGYKVPCVLLSFSDNAHTIPEANKNKTNARYFIYLIHIFNSFNRR